MVCKPKWGMIMTNWNKLIMLIQLIIMILFAVLHTEMASANFLVDYN